MPARVVRSEINSSDSLSRVSPLADLTFRALIVVVDDYGRIDGRLPVLKGLLFPLRSEITEKKLETYLDELAAGPDSPIVRYVVDGRPFIALSGWEKHRGKSKRAETSKYPEPPPGRSADPREIRESPGDPPVGMESRVDDMEARVGAPSASVASAPPAPVKTSASRDRKTRVPDRLADADRERVIEWARSQTPPISPAAVKYAWAVYLSKAKANGYKYVDHARAFMNAMGAGGEAWALKGFEDKPKPVYRRDETGQVLVPNEWRGAS